MRAKNFKIVLCVLFSDTVLSGISYADTEQKITDLQNQVDQLKEDYAKLKSKQQAKATSSANAFNPSIALILNGQYASYSISPEDYKLQGFMPPQGAAGPGERSFSLGESELTLSANVDPQFAGQLTFSITPDETVEVEEAFFRTLQTTEGLLFRADCSDDDLKTLIKKISGQ